MRKGRKPSAPQQTSGNPPSADESKESTAPPSTGQTSSKPSFELRFTTDAAADIQALDGSVRKQLRKVLEKKLAVNPEGYGLPLRGALANYWKHEFGNHRIVYRIYLERRVVAICAVGCGSKATPRTSTGNSPLSPKPGGWRNRSLRCSGSFYRDS